MRHDIWLETAVVPAELFAQRLHWHVAIMVALQTVRRELVALGQKTGRWSPRSLLTAKFTRQSFQSADVIGIAS